VAIRTRRARPTRIAALGLLALFVAVVSLALTQRASSAEHLVKTAVLARSAHRLPRRSAVDFTRRSAVHKRREVRSRLASQQLSPQVLAGQRVIYAYAGLEPPATLVAAIRAGEAGGVIFFANNIASRSQLRGVIDKLQRASLASPVHTRLLMLTDQEGGEVRRLPGAPTLSEKQIGESPNPLGAARAAGTTAGQNLRGAGINVNLAPVLDVYRQPGDFEDQFQRSYSSHPSTVAGLGAGFIAAQQRVGVAATAKHFPGLGPAAASQNTDLRPVTLTSSLSTLRAVDEAPYRNAIAAGVKLVMTSWAIYPALDRRLPAGFSPTVIQGELRRRLGFRGVTITDGMDAGAVIPFGSLSRRAVLAASAGADLILCTGSPEEGLAAARALASAIARHEISRTAAQESVARILALRSRP
jgi:beta-N-acetylhexosaminidase